MADRPILFSAPMVRALLAGTKTQTRRALTVNNSYFNGRPWYREAKEQSWGWDSAWVDQGPSPAGNAGPYLKLPWVAGDAGAWEHTVHRVYPMICPGDRLWCRETWGGYLGAPNAEEFAGGVPVFYRADPEDAAAGIDVWRPSIHMPRWASRLTLYVTDVRVERLQDISEADALAEGVELAPQGHWKCYGATPKPFRGAAPTVLSHARGVVSANPVHSYATLWNSINGPGAWAANPWVSVTTFVPHLGNIDSLPATLASGTEEG